MTKDTVLPCLADLRAVLSSYDADRGWRRDALCATADPEAFFPSPGGAGAAGRMARRVCRGCPVRVACLRFALDHDERDGIWGGLSTGQRDRLRRGQTVPWRGDARRTVRLDSCGCLVECDTRRRAA